MQFSIDLNNLSSHVLVEVACESKNAEVLKMLLQFNEKLVYSAVAKNPYTDKETLRSLYDKYKEGIRSQIRDNISTPVDILHDIVLTTTQFSEAKNMLDNTSLASEDLDDLYERFHKYPSYSGQEFIKKVINHPNVSAETLIKIAEYSVEFVEKVYLTGKVKFVPNDG